VRVLLRQHRGQRPGVGWHRLRCGDGNSPTSGANAAKEREKIRELNDAFRASMTGGRVMMTAGVNALPSDVKAMVIRRVATFADFTADNDPHGEHDFGSFGLAGQSFFWKIDYYDAAMEFGSEDPADPAKTTRVLTIMLACEY
jgi:Protein of unknown function (DUF3768)